MTVKLSELPVLDPDFRPIIMENRAFLAAVRQTGNPTPVMIAVEREQGQTAIYQTVVFAAGLGREEENYRYLERLVKTVLWVKGGWKIIFNGPSDLYDRLRQAYAPDGTRSFDAAFMGRVYEKPFTVVWADAGQMPVAYETAAPIGGNLDGCRIGFDAGGSDRKVAAVIDGKVVFSEEVVWHPKTQSDPDYHYREIQAALQKAAGYLPRVDAIGVSSAGIYVNNRTMVASLFRQVPPDLFDQKIKDIYINLAAAMGGAPLVVKNDGDVTALAGALSLNDVAILGIAMGTSEAAGYIDRAGNITGCLNELSFAPVDLNPTAAVDEWSGDYGCGAAYFSQDAVIRLAPLAGIDLKPELTPAEKLKAVQALMAEGDERAGQIFATIGCYLGYSLAYYAEFYDFKHLLVLGRVTSGAGGALILDRAQEVIGKEFPELAAKISIQLPDESNRRVGQAIAAASLPVLK